jgi:hypothetical protein
VVSAACTLNVIHREPMWLNVLGAFQLPIHAGPILRELPEPSASDQPSVSFEFPRLCFVVGISWERWIDRRLTAERFRECELSHPRHRAGSTCGPPGRHDGVHLAMQLQVRGQVHLNLPQTTPHQVQVRSRARQQQ